MIETYAWPLVNYTENLNGLCRLLEDRLTGVQTGTRSLDAIDITDTDRNNLTVLFEQYRPWLEAHALTASYDQSTLILDEVVQDEPNIHTLIDEIKHFNPTLINELRRRVFLYMPPEDTKLYKEADSFFPRTRKAFPSARYDMDEACRCHALGCYTACVYHCMGVLQYGLYALASGLGVSFSFSIELAEWNAVIGAIEVKIKPFREGPRTDKKDEDLSFYSECAAQFRYFKDAWRNHVAHGREVYDRDQAHSVLIHVRDFMEKLSLRIKETV
jgi:hypothetical protein